MSGVGKYGYVSFLFCSSWVLQVSYFRLLYTYPIIDILYSACGFGQGIMFATATNAHSAFATEIERWNAALFAMSLITNVLVTFLIAGRVWYVNILLKWIESNGF